jgi:hypothetical protein
MCVIATMYLIVFQDFLIWQRRICFTLEEQHTASKRLYTRLRDLLSICKIVN